MTEPNLMRLRRFVLDFATLLDGRPDEPEILARGGALLGDLVAHDDWLPDQFAVPSGPYAQYLLHCDSAERFSVVSFVWSPGGGTPVHDHTVWGLIGMLRGAEISQPYAVADGSLTPGGPVRLSPGDVEAVSPRIGDVHRVTNALDDAPSVSIHVYGANIGAVRRSSLREDGTRRPFVSGYTGAVTPNLWNGILPPP
jgi:3-mercaptopropionate dioxygenase